MPETDFNLSLDELERIQKWYNRFRWGGEPEQERESAALFLKLHAEKRRLENLLPDQPSARDKLLAWKREV